jgi:hypothetical protein
MKGVVILHETLHEMHQKKQNGVIFKIDFKRNMIKLNGLLLSRHY